MGGLLAYNIYALDVVQEKNEERNKLVTSLRIDSCFTTFNIPISLKCEINHVHNQSTTSTCENANPVISITTFSNDAFDKPIYFT